MNYNELEILKLSLLLGIYSKEDIQCYGDYALLHEEPNELYISLSTCSILNDSDLIALLSNNRYTQKIVLDYFWCLFKQALQEYPENLDSVYRSFIRYTDLVCSSYNLPQDVIINLGIFNDHFLLKRDGFDFPLVILPEDLIRFIDVQAECMPQVNRFVIMGLKNPLSVIVQP